MSLINSEINLNYNALTNMFYLMIQNQQQSQ